VLQTSYVICTTNVPQGTGKNKNNSEKSPKVSMPVVRTSSYRPAPTFQPKGKPTHKKRSWLLLLIALILVVGIVHATQGDAMSNTPAVQSGVKGACLDLRHDDPSAPVQIWNCNNSAAQRWSVGSLHIRHTNNQCLGVNNDATSANAPITVSDCSDAPGQVWLAEQSGFRNPHSGMCLAAPDSAMGVQLVIASCRSLGQANEAWTPVVTRGKQTQKADTSCKSNDKGTQIACYAAKEWETWQAPGADHNALLNMYTINVPYEAWCADFVSYVYKEAGYPFTQGETNGWNENDANKIESMGFVRRDPSDYVPKTGDVAYFDYDGGHVEIVASGGKTPTFIYGNSGTTDPATGNGQMAANTITADGPNGQLMYYLTPQ
jgi:Ricin-type beta-trefoil lectin domain/CHAP domain